MRVLTVRDLIIALTHMPMEAAIGLAGSSATYLVGSVAEEIGPEWQLRIDGRQANGLVLIGGGSLIPRLGPMGPKEDSNCMVDYIDRMASGKPDPKADHGK